MKLVIDRDENKAWRFSIIDVNGLNVKIHEQGTASDARAAFEAGYKVAVDKFRAPALPATNEPPTTEPAK